MSFAGSGSNNSILVSGCKNLENLTVTLEVTQDLITVGDKRFSLQLNSYPQPASITPNSTPGTTFPGKVVGQLDWFQYLIIVANNRVSFEIQYWANAKSYQTGGAGRKPSRNTVAPGLHAKPHGYESLASSLSPLRHNRQCRWLYVFEQGACGLTDNNQTRYRQQRKRDRGDLQHHRSRRQGSLNHHTAMAELRRSA
jgi:hypothetical protein